MEVKDPTLQYSNTPFCHARLASETVLNSLNHSFQHSVTI